MRNIFLLLIAFSLFSCSALRNKENKQKGGKALPENHEQLLNLEVTDQFLLGKRSVYTGDYPKALAHFVRCLKENPDHAASMYEISRIYTLKQDYKEAIKWAVQAYEHESENVWYLRHYIDVLKKGKKYVEASKYLKKLIEVESNKKQNYYDLANTYIYQKDYDAAIEVYKTIESKFGFEEGVALQRKKIYLNQNNLKAALKEIDILISHFPNETKYLGMKGHILNLQGDIEGALEVYNQIIKLDPNDGKVHLALSTLYFSIGKEDKAHEEELLAFRNESLSIDHKIGTVMNYFKKSPWSKQQESHLVDLLNALAVTHPEEAKAHAVYGDYLIQKKQDEKALKSYTKALSLDSTKYLIWEQIILIQNSLENYEEVQNYCEGALQFFPQQSALYFFSALSAYKLEDYKQTIESCEMGLNFTYKPAQQMDFYSLSGKAYRDTEDYENAIVQFEQISLIKANVPEALAEEAYCMAMLKNDLAEAEQKIKSALELDHQNQRYFFIYATVLLEQGKLDQAKHWIEKSIQNSSESQHFEAAGDIYLKAGNKEPALNYYRKALKMQGNKKRIELKMSQIKG